MANDVDFQKLGAEFDNASGGDIKNAVLKAAQIATTEPGPDNEKRIHQRHFETGMRDVIAAKKVMEQSIYSETGDGSHALSAMTGMQGAWSQLSRNQETLEEEVGEVTTRVEEIEGHISALPAIVERFDDAARRAQLQLKDELAGKIGEVQNGVIEYSKSLHELRETFSAQTENWEKSRGELSSQLAVLPQQIETKMRTQSDELRNELQARNEELQNATKSLRLCLTLSVSSLAAAIIAIAIAFAR